MKKHVLVAAMVWAATGQPAQGESLDKRSASSIVTVAKILEVNSAGQLCKADVLVELRTSESSSESSVGTCHVFGGCQPRIHSQWMPIRFFCADLQEEAVGTMVLGNLEYHCHMMATGECRWHEAFGILRESKL